VVALVGNSLHAFRQNHVHPNMAVELKPGTSPRGHLDGQFCVMPLLLMTEASFLGYFQIVVDVHRPEYRQVEEVRLI